ncbi:MAG: 50S ribosomal protein L20 [Candidatus Gottesmanbacteria bacterium]|nr:50S ribosomal protein L20 [Candidatus Gottesmanbacteria bacterium]
MRVKRGVHAGAKHHKILRANKGYRMTKRRLIRVATQAYLHAGEYAHSGRKNRKRDFRQLWITRISEATKQNGLSYSVFMSKLKAANIDMDRKVLANLVTQDPEIFEEIVDKVKTVN